MSVHEGVRTKGYKLINFYQNDGYNLFDLKKYPDELINVAGNPEYATILKKMKKELQVARKKYKEPLLK